MEPIGELISSSETNLMLSATLSNIYSLEIVFSSNPELRREQSRLFLRQLSERDDVSIDYKQFPPIREFDAFGKLNFTEVVRHRRTVDQITTELSQLLPSDFDLSHLRESLLSGTNSRLLGEQTGSNYNFRHSVFSFSSAVEEMTNIILTFLADGEIENKTLGQKLGELRNIFSDTPKYFVNVDVLEHLTRLLTEVRNSVVHPTPNDSTNLEALQSSLASQLTDTFIRFAVKTMSAFLDTDGNLVNVQVLDPISPHNEDSIYYYGFDGDSTGDYLEVGFTTEHNAEEEVLKRSQAVRKAIKEIRSAISKTTRDQSSVIYAEGDNGLFKMTHNYMLGALEIRSAERRNQGHETLYDSIRSVNGVFGLTGIRP